MNNEKEIKEMGVAIFKSYGSLLCQPCGSFDSCEKRGKPDCGLCDGLAEELINAGYGNVKQAVKEFAERLKQEISKFIHEKQEFSKEISFDTVAERFAIEVDRQFYSVCGVAMIKIIDNLITEPYGADDDE